MRSLGYESLKLKQEVANIECALGADIIVALPTEYGNNTNYCCFLHMFDKLKSVDERLSVVVVASS